MLFRHVSPHFSNKKADFWVMHELMIPVTTPNNTVIISPSRPSHSRITAFTASEEWIWIWVTNMTNGVIFPPPSGLLDFGTYYTTEHTERVWTHCEILLPEMTVATVRRLSQHFTTPRRRIMGPTGNMLEGERFISSVRFEETQRNVKRTVNAI